MGGKLYGATERTPDGNSKLQEQLKRTSNEKNKNKNITTKTISITQNKSEN